MLALVDRHLTAPADAATAANGVEVDSKFPRRVEHRGSLLEAAAPSRRREDDERATSR